MEPEGNLTFDPSYFYDVDYENRLCVDCRTPKPTHISINNSVLICSTCAIRHQTLGPNVSYVRELTDEFDTYLLTFFSRGSNSRFMRLCAQYKLNELPIEIKYTTNIAMYYRITLKSEVLAEEPPEPISNELALLPCDPLLIIFPEFNNYKIYQGNVEVKTRNQLYKEKFSETLKTIGEGVKGTTNYIIEKAKDPKVKETLSATYEGAKIVGGYAYPVLKAMTKTTVKGLGYLFGMISTNLKEVEKTMDSQVNDTNNETNNNQIKLAEEEPKQENKEPIENKEDNKKEYTDINKVSSSKINSYEFTPVNDFPTYDEINQREDTNQNNNLPPDEPAPTN